MSYNASNKEKLMLIVLLTLILSAITFYFLQKKYECSEALPPFCLASLVLCALITLIFNISHVEEKSEIYKLQKIDDNYFKLQDNEIIFKYDNEYEKVKLHDVSFNDLENYEVPTLEKNYEIHSPKFSWYFVIYTANSRKPRIMNLNYKVYH